MIDRAGWEKSEKLSAKLYGRRVAASGAGIFEKLDIQGIGTYEGWRAENKYTTQRSFPLTWDMLMKGIRQAIQMGVRPFYIIDFSDRGRFVILREEDWIRINEAFYQ